MSVCVECGSGPAVFPSVLCPTCRERHDELWRGRTDELTAWRLATHEAVNSDARVVAAVRCGVCGGKPIGQVVAVGAGSLYLRTEQPMQVFDPEARTMMRPAEARRIGGRPLWVGYPIAKGRTHDDLFPWHAWSDDDQPKVNCRNHGEIKWSERDTAILRASSADSAIQTIRLMPTT